MLYAPSLAASSSLHPKGRPMPAERPANIDFEALEAMGLDALRQEWRQRMRNPLPALRSAEFLRRELAWCLNALTDGDLDAKLRQRMDRLAKRHTTGGAQRPLSSSPATGSTLVREWDGVAYSVVVLADAYLFEGKTYKSLSAIARHITGVRWSGPRFFGLAAGRAR